MALTDTQIRAALKAGVFTFKNKKGEEVQKPYIVDDENLWFEIIVAPTDRDPGEGAWRFRYYRPDGRPNRISLGTYPEVSLSDARDEAREQRKLVAAGKDPAELRKEKKAATQLQKTFAGVMEEWYGDYVERGNLAKSSRDAYQTKKAQLDELFGKQLFAAITVTDVSSKLAEIASKHKVKARMLRAMLSEIYCYGIPKGYAKTNPAADSLFKLPKFKSKPLPAIVAPSQVGELLRRLQTVDCRFLTRLAVEFLARTFPRPHNVARMKWDQLNSDWTIWTIPGEEMKMRKAHRVPLSAQAIAILKLARQNTNSEFVFSTNAKPMSTKTFARVLRAMGYSTSKDHCAHGFRSTASTLLRAEMRWLPEIIELQLAHGDENKIAATYNRALDLEEAMQAETEIVDRVWEVRVAMMQHWSNRLDKMRDNVPAPAIVNNVVELRAA